MAEVHPFPNHRREFITDGDRSELRATWHNESGYVVISLWRGQTCVATSHLTPAEAARLSGFITSGLAELAGSGLSRGVTSIRALRRTWVRASFGAVRHRLASMLDRVTARLRRDG